MIELLNFRKPQRYIGNEWNVIRKDPKDKINICLCYPDLYEIGMSNVGIKIIYGLLNEYPKISCERAFMPADDLADYMQTSATKLFSLETKTALCEFDIVGFQLGYELNYTNFLSMLELGGIALKAQDRKKVIVLAGGIANPEPMADFVDVFFLGEFEEKASDFVKIIEKYKNKEERLKALCEIEGFYVPKFYDVNFVGGEYVFEKKEKCAQLPIKRVFVKDLNKSYYPTNWLTPHTKIIHDRAQIEIARGCPNQCTFCQARSVYFPYRERKLEHIVSLIENIYKTSGYEEFSLLSLSVSDHSQIEDIIDVSYNFFKKNKIGLSLPSLRVDDVIGRLYSKLMLLKKISLTVAVEAGSQCMRDTMKKNIDIAKLFEAAKIIKSLKIRHMKIYFMFGFMQETEDDLAAIGRLLENLSTSSNLGLNVSINVFIPKPFSSWQDCIMDTESTLENKRKIILKNIPKKRNVKLMFSYLKKSILEGVISRADRKFSAVIYRAYKKGARFDGYGEKFSWSLWESAMKEENIDYRNYLERKTKNFPWSFIETKGAVIRKT